MINLKIKIKRNEFINWQKLLLLVIQIKLKWMKLKRIKENIEWLFIILMKIMWLERDKLNLDQLNKKIIYKIKIIKEESNWWIEYKKRIMYYKVIIGERII